MPTTTQTTTLYSVRREDPVTGMTGATILEDTAAGPVVRLANVLATEFPQAMLVIMARQMDDPTSYTVLGRRGPSRPRLARTSSEPAVWTDAHDAPELRSDGACYYCGRPPYEPHAILCPEASK